LEEKVMETDQCDIIHPNGVKEKKQTVIDGYTIKYHASGKTMWSKGKVIDDQPDGYWEWYRTDGTLKRSGYFEKGEPVGEWVTYNNKGEKYKTTNRNKD
jgi:antitoxin component YwqK of YwqJK toxin-antitoxin module